MNTIPYSRQSISQADIDAVVAVLRSDFLTQGKVVPEFESSVAKYCNARFAVTFNSATSALHIACLTLGVGKGDIVWTSPISFVASANSALYCGASIDFVDIDPLTYNLSVACLIKKLDIAKRIGKLPKVIIPVHFSGQACDMASIYELSKKYGFRIIEDASHAIGGKYKNEPIGNGSYSDITVFSFHPVKIITTGEGGMAVTNDASLAKNMRMLRSHGITTNPEDMQPCAANEMWNYQQIDLGYNYRMTDFQAALGLSQLQNLDEFVLRRHTIAQRYSQLLAALPLQTPYQHESTYSAFHLYVIRLRLAEISKTQRQVFDDLYKAGILVNMHYIPIYLQPYYVRMGFDRGHCPEAEKYYAEAISIPLYPSLTEVQQGQVIAAISEVVNL